MDDKAVMSAQSLLFGPRRSRQEVPASVQKAKKSEMAKISKNLAKERRKDDFARAFSDAGEEAERGNFAPLGSLPETQHGLKMVEKQSLRLLTDQLSRMAETLERSSISDNPLIADQIITSEGDLQSFLALQEKMKGHNMPEKVMREIDITISSNIMLSSGIKTIQELIDRKDEIGPLPEIIRVASCRHLVKDGKPVCGEVSNFTGGAGAWPRESILSQRLTCHNCLDHRKEADLLPPDEWAGLIRAQCPFTWMLWRRSSDSKGRSAADSLNSDVTSLRSLINGNLDSAGLPDIF